MKRPMTELCLQINIKNYVYMQLLHTGVLFTNYFITTILVKKNVTRKPAFWDTPIHPMITHTRDSYQIQSQNTRHSQNWIFF